MVVRVLAGPDLVLPAADLAVASKILIYVNLTVEIFFLDQTLRSGFSIAFFHWSLNMSSIALQDAWLF